MTERTCPYCREKFIQEETDWVRCGNRYAHRACAEKKDEKEKKKQEKKEEPKKHLKKNLKKCYYCNKEFDISEGYRKVRNRFAHIECYEKNYQPDEDYVHQIYELLKDEVHMVYDYAQCEKQRKHFIDKLGYTNEGIYLALKYFYLVKKASPEKSGNRIGIVSYVYNEAQTYYKNLETEKKKIGEAICHQLDQEEEIVHVAALPKKRKRKKIDLDSIGGD